MGGTVYFRVGAEGKINVGKAYNRLFHGPTWGIRAASKKLAGLAQKGEVGPGEIQDVLAQHPKLALRLDARGIDMLSLDKGMSKKDLKHLFRAALYKTAIMESFFSKGFGTSQERSADFPLTFGDIHESVRFRSGKQLDEAYKLLECEVSSMDRFLEKYRGTYVIPILICAGLAIVFSPFFPGIFDSLLSKYESLRKLANAALWGIAGGCVGAAPGQGWEALHLNRKRCVLAGLAWKALNDFSRAGLEPAELQKGQKYLNLLDRSARIKYLASLGYERIQSLSLNSNTEKRALILCKDTPLAILYEIAKGEDGGDQAMDALISRKKIHEVDLAVLKKARSKRVRVLAHFCDPDLSPAAMATILNESIPVREIPYRNRKIVGKRWVDDPDHYEVGDGRCIPTGGYMEKVYEEETGIERYFDSADLKLAGDALRLRSAQEQSKILEELARINPDLMYAIRRAHENF